MVDVTRTASDIFFNFPNDGPSRAEIVTHLNELKAAIELLDALLGITPSEAGVALFEAADKGLQRSILGVYSSLEVDATNSVFHIQDQKPQGTNGGDFVLGAWRTRELNTVVTNEISGASLSSNQFTLPAGAYIIEASAPAYFVDFHVCRLQNITDGITAALGTSTIAENVSSADSRSFIKAKLAIAGPKVFELQHQSTLTNLSSGFGARSNFQTEVYSDVFIRRVG